MLASHIFFLKLNQASLKTLNLFSYKSLLFCNRVHIWNKRPYCNYELLATLNLGPTLFILQFFFHGCSWTKTNRVTSFLTISITLVLFWSSHINLANKCRPFVDFFLCLGTFPFYKKPTLFLGFHLIIYFLNAIKISNI